MGHEMRGKRGGHATHAKDFRDTILNVKEAALLLRKPISQVRALAEAGELPVEGWEGSQPYFKAGAVMDRVTAPGG